MRTLVKCLEPRKSDVSSYHERTSRNTSPKTGATQTDVTRQSSSGHYSRVNWILCHAWIQCRHTIACKAYADNASIALQVFSFEATSRRSCVRADISKAGNCQLAAPSSRSINRFKDQTAKVLRGLCCLDLRLRLDSHLHPGGVRGRRSQPEIHQKCNAPIAPSNCRGGSSGCGVAIGRRFGSERARDRNTLVVSFRNLLSPLSHARVWNPAGGSSCGNRGGKRRWTYRELATLHREVRAVRSEQNRGELAANISCVPATAERTL